MLRAAYLHPPPPPSLHRALIQRLSSTLPSGEYPFQPDPHTHIPSHPHSHVQVQSSYTYWSGYSLPPRRDGVFRALPNSAAQEGDKVGDLCGGGGGMACEGVWVEAKDVCVMQGKGMNRGDRG